MVESVTRYFGSRSGLVGWGGFDDVGTYGVVRVVVTYNLMAFWLARRSVFAGLSYNSANNNQIGSVGQRGR